MRRGGLPSTLAFARVWRQVDARDEVLGKLAQRIATTLMGKHKPIFSPEVDSGDHVVVTNARHVVVTGQKAEQKTYFSHSTYPGAAKFVPYAQMMERTPTRIIEKAVSGMLPKNRLRKRRLARLHVFPDGEHPFGANILRDYTAAEGVTLAGLPTTKRELRLASASAASTLERPPVSD